MRITASLICVVMLLASGPVLASQVTNVALQYQDGSAVAHIDIKGPVRFTHQIEEAKDGKPFRVIVDVLSATHNLPAKNFSSLPECPVQKIRTSQYAVTPEKVVRVVYDMEEETFYRVDSDDKSITLFFPDKQQRRFAVWSSTAYATTSDAGKLTPPEKPSSEHVSTSPARAEEENKTAAELNEAIDQDRLLSLAGKPAQEKPVPAAKRQEPSSDKKTQVEKSPSVKEQQRQVPAVVVDVPYGPELDPDLLEPPISSALAEASAARQAKGQKPPVVASRQPDTERLVSQSEKAQTEIGSKQVVVTGEATQPAKPETELTEPKQKKPAVVQKEIAQTSPDDNKTAEVGVKSEQAVVPTPAVAKKAQTKVPQQKTSSPVEKKQPSAKPVKADKQAGPVLASASNQDMPEAAEKNAPKKVTTPPSTTTADQKKAKASQDSTATLKDKKSSGNKPSTSRFRRSPTLPTKIKGTLVAEFPKRLVIKYKARNYRDPFETLINETKTYNSPIERRIPNVEGLTLVGVLESENGINSALFEDKNGYGYILKEGDKVRKGYVLRVERDRVYFQVFEYGWSRTVALNIDED